MRWPQFGLGSSGKENVYPFCQKVPKAQANKTTVHRVKTEHTGKVWEGKEQPGKVFSAKWVYMETEPTWGRARERSQPNRAVVRNEEAESCWSSGGVDCCGQGNANNNLQKPPFHSWRNRLPLPTTTTGIRSTFSPSSKAGTRASQDLSDG